MKQKRIRIGRLDTAGGIAHEHGRILKKLMREMIDPQLATRLSAWRCCLPLRIPLSAYPFPFLLRGSENRYMRHEMERVNGDTVTPIGHPRG